LTTRATAPPRARKTTTTRNSVNNEIGRLERFCADGSSTAAGDESTSGLIPVRMIGTCDVIGVRRRPSRGVPHFRQKF
jgi:hypothetical protein